MQQISLAFARPAPILRFIVAVQQALNKPENLTLEMQMMTVEQVVAANKANVETLFGLTNKAFEGVERLVELNLQVAKAAMTEAAEGAKAALSVKDAQELLALQAGLLQPSAEKAVAYGRHVYDIAATTNAEVGKVAETQMAEFQKKFLAGVDTAIKNAPAGTESAVSLVKSAIAAANNAYESVQKAAKQAADIADANFQAVTNTAVKATQTTSKSKRA
jgi:phasin family protein